MSWYRVGTIALTNGSPTVTGTGTAWISNAAIGEGLRAPDGRIYEITNIASDTSLTITPNYLGSTQTGQVYEIVPTQSFIRDLATQAADLVNQYSTIANFAGQGKFDDGTADAPGIRFSDDLDTGLYRIGSNNLGISAGGTKIVDVSTSGISVTGTINGTTVPTSATLVTTTGTQTLTNKTINFANNTIQATSAQIAAAVTDETGSGALVFGTNPTISGASVSGGTINNTPIGGTTPNTGAFTNLSYTGTLTGGTGVVNLGSGQLVKDASGNVGIGTSSPASLLDVNGNAQAAKFVPTGNVTAGNGMYLPAANTVAFSTNGSERMRITSGGNVGIGTASPTQRLVVNGAVVSSGSASANQTAAAAFDYSPGFLSARILSWGPVGTGGNVTFWTGAGNASANERMRIDASGRVGIGTMSPGERLDVNGDALINGKTVGRGLGNVASNTVVGTNAFSSSTTGPNNTAVGTNTLQNNTTGANNTAVGINALRDNVAAANNCAFGLNSLLLNTTGAQNTAFGQTSLPNNTTGNENVAIGVAALQNNTTGSGNIGIGFRGSNSAYAPVFNPTTENNRLVMGHTQITNAYVQVAWTVTSDARDKTGFEEIPHGLDFVNQLEPTAYYFKKSRDNDKPHGRKRYGFKAQDILALEGDNPVIIDDEDQDRLKYCGESLVPVLVNAIKELTAKVNALEAQLEGK